MTLLANLGEIIVKIYLIKILIWGVVIAAIIFTTILILRYICRYLAKQISKYFNYDYLSERTAQEIIRREIEIKKHTTEKQETE